MMSEVKEPWQETRTDYLARLKERGADEGSLERLAIAHEKFIKKSLVEGKPVPQEVLKEYPALGEPYLPTRPEGITEELKKLSNRLEVALSEGDNPVSAKCALVLDSPIKCYDFSGSRRFAACRAWQLMEELKISWQEAITKAWEEIKSKCTWE